MTRAATSIFPAITVEGSILASATLDAIHAEKAGEQSETDYGIRQGLSIRDEISLAFRVLQAHVQKFHALETPGQAATIRFVRGMLEEVFGFENLEDAENPVALQAGDGRVPVVVVPPADSLDRASESLSADRRRSAAFGLQDHLNEREGALWGLATNGTTIRLMRDNASLTRPAWLEADIGQMAETEDIASFALLWFTIHRTRFGRADAPATDCTLERWRDAGVREGEAARDKLADQVEQALRTLGSGFLTANPDLRARLTSGTVPLADWYNELLRLVYRLIFLMVAEDRQLLHPEDATVEARELYARGYALSQLRELAIRRATWDRHHDRYEGLKVVFHGLAQGEPALGLPALGGLFGKSQLPHLETAQLPNRALLETIYRLGWLRDKDALVPVNWRAMETEELGSVYESLLELQPQLTDGGRTLAFAQDAAETKGNQRKTTGAYYTPDSLVQALLDTALDPVLDRTEKAAEDPAEALLNLTVVDPACGSGHFLLAAARRIATRVARHRATGTPAAADFRHAMRDVARLCLHGVDRNPMAVELTKVALWIETVDPGLPLGFFDAQIRCGDALLGVFDQQVLYQGIPDDAYKPLTGDDKDTAKYFKQLNRDAIKGQGRLGLGRKDLDKVPGARPLTEAIEAVRAMPEDSVAQVEKKRRRFRELHDSAVFHQTELACDVYMAAFVMPKPAGVLEAQDQRLPTTEDVWAALHGREPSDIDRVARVARESRSFHWPVEFPDVMASGGFDVVVGNPPWDVLQLSDKEYFANRKPEIAELAGVARKRAIQELAEDDPAAFKAFIAEKRRFETFNNFARFSGRFDLTARGKINSYPLFAELFAKLAGPQGRAGVILPTGIATDATTAPFFASLVSERRLSTLIDFENRDGLFPAVHRSFKFCVLTLARDIEEARFAFFLRHPSELAEPERTFVLSPAQIETINPNTGTAPVFRSRADAELTTNMFSAASILVADYKKDGNPWQVDFHTRLWNMGEDAAYFDSIEELSDRYPNSTYSEVEGLTPLYEAKMFHIFDHRWTCYDNAEPYAVRSEQKEDKAFEPMPRYFVPSTEMERRLVTQNWVARWLLTVREITNSTNERTVISAILPRTAVGHTATLILPRCEVSVLPALIANLNSIALDFCARQLMGGTHLTLSVLKQLPVFPPKFYGRERLDFIASRVIELTYTSYQLADFATDLGFYDAPFDWDIGRRQRIQAELDAFYARAYGLDRDGLRYVLDPAEVSGENYPSETFRVLKNNEIREFGEYRTARLVLEAWDRMAEDGTFRSLDL